jgi:endoglucanase
MSYPSSRKVCSLVLLGTFLFVSLLITACMQQTATPEPELSSEASTYTIYKDALASNWQNWNWNEKTINLASTQGYGGSKGIQAVLNDWGGFSVRYGGNALATSGYSGVSFKVFLQGSGSRLEVMVYQNDDTAFASKVVTTTANTWQTVNLTWAQLGNPSVIKRIAFKDGTGSGSSFYLDDIVLLGGSVPPTNTTWQLSPAINLGGLEAPTEGDWGYKVEEKYLKIIKDAGFKSVRIPVRWSSHTSGTNYTIDPSFFARVDKIIGWAHAQNLLVVLDMHHWGRNGSDYDSLFANPSTQRDRFMKIWQQVATHYKNYSNDNLYFELLNEPHEDFEKGSNFVRCSDFLPANQCFAADNQYWVGFMQEGLKTIRNTGANNSTRKVIIGPADYNGALDDTFGKALPASDRNIIVTTHMYEPFCFTHYKINEEYGKCPTWSGSNADKAPVTQALDAAVAWGKKYNRPMYIGEWGAFTATDYASRERYFRYAQSELNKRGLPWAFWDFQSESFGIFNTATDRFDSKLLNAVLGR